MPREVAELGGRGLMSMMTTLSSKVSSVLDGGTQPARIEKGVVFAANLTHLESRKAAIRFPTPPPQR